MNRPVLLVRNAGFGETPVPADALMQPGATLNVIDQNDGSERLAIIRAVVPAGVPQEYAIADQNGLPRPLMISTNKHRGTTYVIETDGRQVLVTQAKMLKGLTAACPDCLGTGRGSATDGEAKCETCGGAGRRDAREIKPECAV